MDSESLSEFFSRSEFDDTNVSCNMAAGGGVTSPDDIFSVLEAWEAVNNSSGDYLSQVTPLDTEPAAGLISATAGNRLVSQRSTSSRTTPTLDHYSENDQNETETSRLCKRRKVINNVPASITAGSDIELASPGQDGRMTHITVERNRRKQMIEHLTVLRSLMPCFYVKRGDQASIIGGVVNYINELQQVLQSLEAKKQRKVYSEVLSPRIASSPRSSQISSPRKPPLSPRISVPISPRTPQPSSPYVGPPPRLHHQVVVAGLPSPTCSSTSSINDSVNELVAHSKTAVAEVEVKFSGPNLLLKTVAPRVPGQVVRIISTLEDLSLEVLQLDITSVDETIIYSFTIKIGIECQLSAEELAHQIQQTFC